jgi:hypothetical protein
VWVPTVFTKNRDRLLEAAVARKFLAELMDLKVRCGLLSDEHFSVDGTQIAAWASMKSFKAKDGSAPAASPLGADKGYDAASFVADMRAQRHAAHRPEHQRTAHRHRRAARRRSAAHGGTDPRAAAHGGGGATADRSPPDQ